MKALLGKFVLLRAPEPEDLEFLYNLENNTEIWQLSNTLTPFSRFTLKQYIESATQDIYEIKQVRFMVELVTNETESKKTIGTIDLFDFDPFNSRAGVGIIIADISDRKKGFADDALETLIKYAFEILKLHQLFCNISIDNIDSLNLFKKRGFIVAGAKKDWNRHLSGWADEYLLQLINPVQ